MLSKYHTSIHTLKFNYLMTWNSKQQDLRCKLRVVNQVLQRITAAEFVKQARQVANDCWRVRGIDVA